MNYEELFTRFYHNGTGYLDQQDNSQSKASSFHIGCIYTKKNKCYCKWNENSQMDKMSDFILKLNKGEYDIDVSGPTIQIKSNKDCGSYSSNKKEIIKEQIKATNYRHMKEYIKHVNESYLNLGDYREVEKSINDDKKICEKCNCSLYGDNYHKGWKNDNGDYVLLCIPCSKKYFQGANEIKYETRRDDYMMKQPSYQNMNYHNNSSNIVIPPFKTDRNTNDIHINLHSNTYHTNSMMNGNSMNNNINATHRNVNFQVINTAKMDDSLRRKDFEFVCSIPKCSKSGRKTDFIQCFNCQKYYHPTCIDSSFTIKYTNRFNWYCPQCVRCCHCLMTNNPLIKCNTCDRGFHQSCYQMIPIGTKMYCLDCIKCKNCMKTLQPLTLQNQNETLSMVKGYRVCEDCWKYYYKNGHYCPTCLKIYKQQQQYELSTIYCNKCLNSYHIECERISIEEYNEMTKKKNNFTCSYCKPQ